MIHHQPLMMILILAPCVLSSELTPSRLAQWLGGQGSSIHYVFVGILEESKVRWSKL